MELAAQPPAAPPAAQQSPEGNPPNMKSAAMPPPAPASSMFGTFKIQTPLPSGTTVPPAPQALPPTPLPPAAKPLRSEPPAQPAAQPGGLRFDVDKVRYDLLPADALHALAEHYTRGAAKYADRNWEKGMAWTRCFGPLMRHAWAWMRGEDFDPETATHHMIAVAWNALALYCYATRGLGQDDRPRLTPTFTEGEAYVITTKTNGIPFVATFVNNHFAPWGLELSRADYIPACGANVLHRIGKLAAG